MKLHEYLKEEFVCLKLESTAKADAIAELAARLRGHRDVADFDGFLAAIYAREEDASTGIGNHVAIPHARTDTVQGFVVAIGLAPSGIEFSAVDNQPVHLVILMGIPTKVIKDYLKLLSHLSLLLKQPGFIKDVLRAKDAQSLIRSFAKHEE